MGLGPTYRHENGVELWCTLLQRGRRRSVYTLDEVRPFLSLVGNARFEPICVASLLCPTGVIAREGV